MKWVPPFAFVFTIKVAVAQHIIWIEHFPNWLLYQSCRDLWHPKWFLAPLPIFSVLFTTSICATTTVNTRMKSNMGKVVISINIAKNFCYSKINIYNGFRLGENSFKVCRENKHYKCKEVITTVFENKGRNSASNTATQYCSHVTKLTIYHTHKHWFPLYYVEWFQFCFRTNFLTFYFSTPWKNTMLNNTSHLKVQLATTKVHTSHFNVWKFKLSSYNCKLEFFYNECKFGQNNPSYAPLFWTPCLNAIFIVSRKKSSN